MNESTDELRALLEYERAARVEAERTGRLKDDFLDALGRELRAPLNAILGWSRLLEHGRMGDQEIRSGGQTIARNARTLAHIVDDLLDLSAIASGNIKVEAEETDICEIVDVAVERHQGDAASKGITLSKTLETQDCQVFGEPRRLQQIVWNLLSNAIKFTPRGGSVHVTVRSVGGYCDVEVADTGAGIAKELLPYVFDRFWRADSSTEHHYAGLGVGLALAKRLAELHGGTVTATSPGLNQGATFTVVIPRVAPRVEEGSRVDSGLTFPRTAAVSHAAKSAQTDLSGLRVLVVDDEPDTLELLKRVLGDSRAQVAAAPSVEVALATLSGFEPHVLISDVSMPGRDGYELIRAVRTTVSPAQLPAAALTAFARPEDAERAREAGFQVHLSKPVEPEQLVKAVALLAGRA
jgi:CheY-like chemotaxis protein/nitrogen-specific signal transduction histidine kinase